MNLYKLSIPASVLCAIVMRPSAAAPPPGADLFALTNVPAFTIEIEAAGIRSLRINPRLDVKATVRLGNEVFRDVGIHVKGSQGSLQSIDARPALTLSFNRFVPKQKCHELRKLHLNNSAEDPTLLTDVLCSELFRQAGIPAARGAYATLKLNNRHLGLYVLKEGLTREFLAQYFRRTDGNLYDGGFRLDVDRRLERIHGEGPDDQTDRLALLAAAREVDPGRRWQRLVEVLDMDRFLRSLAMQTITWNWDGYAMARNNYRIYHDPESDKLVFIPHGLDQMFWKPEGTIYPRMNAIVAAAVMRASEGRSLYRARLASLHTNQFNAALVSRRVNELAALIAPYFPGASDAAVKLRRLIVARSNSIGEQLRLPEPQTLSFVNDVAALTRWNKVSAGAAAGAVLDEITVESKWRVLRIKAGERTSASWMMRVWLPPGLYEFSGRVSTRGVKASDGNRNFGAGLRVGAEAPGVTPRLVEDSDWQELRCRILARGPDEIVDLVCELRGASGEAWFDPASLHLKRLGSSSRVLNFLN